MSRGDARAGGDVGPDRGSAPRHGTLSLAETTHPGQLDGHQMRVDGDGTNRMQCGAQIRQGFDDRGPPKTERALQHGGSLILDLHTDDAACEDPLAGSLALVLRALGPD